MGLTALLIDKNDRIGDNWRNRYRVSDPTLPDMPIEREALDWTSTN